MLLKITHNSLKKKKVKIIKIEIQNTKFKPNQII